MPGIRMGQRNTAACGCCGNHYRAGYNPVRNNLIRAGVQLIHALDRNRIGTCTDNLSAHPIQEILQILNLRLSGRPRYRGRSYCHRSGHHNIFCRSNTGIIEMNVTSCKLCSAAGNPSITLLNLCSKQLKAL